MLLLQQCSSNLSDTFFCISRVFSAFRRAQNPCSLASSISQREHPSYSNGGHYSSETAGARPLGRRARSARATPSEEDSAPRSTLLASAFWSHVPRQLLHSSSAADLPKPHPLDLFAPRSASMLHPASLALRNYLHISASSQHTPQDRPSTCPSFCASGALGHQRTPKTSILASTLLIHHLLRAKSDCVYLCCRSQTDVRGTSLDCEPCARMTPYLGPGARVGAPSFWCCFGRTGGDSR